MAAVPQKRRALAGCVAVRVSRIPGRVNTVYVKDQKKKPFFIASGNRGSALRHLYFFWHVPTYAGGRNLNRWVQSNESLFGL